MDKAAREKARDLCDAFKHTANREYLYLRQALDALDAADAEIKQLKLDRAGQCNSVARSETKALHLAARVSELEAAVETATPLIGARNDVAHPAIKEANINEAWHVLNRVRLPAPPVGDR